MSDDRVEFLRRSFHAVDGLWFVNCESRLTFEEALALDRAVWESMGKVQARKAAELVGESGSVLERLRRALDLKFRSEGWGYEIDMPSDNELRVRITACPWFKILEKSNRTHLEPIITNEICRTEYGTWAREFGDQVGFRLDKRELDAGSCTMVYRKEETKSDTV